MSGHTLTTILATWGYLAVFAFVAVDAAGIPFPGETMLIAAAVYAGSGGLRIPFVILAAALGAFAGFCVSYTIGRTGGRALVLRYGHFVRLDPAKLARAETFFQKYGDATVFLGRFVSVGRAFAALLAGLNRMNLAKFMIFNAAGAAIWACLFGVAGFELGHDLPLLHRLTHGFAIGAIVIVVAIVVGAVLWHLIRRRRSQQNGPVRAE